MKALVVYGSKYGGTDGLAHMVGDALGAAGLNVTVRPAGARSTYVAAYDVVVVGGGVYVGRWHKDARRFVRRNRDVLRTRQVWLFSSGPTGPEAADAERLPAPRGVQRLMTLVGARGHRMFGGRLTTRAGGMMRRLAKGDEGDWRRPEDVAAWAAEIVRDLQLATQQL